ncbi:putative bifunctional diguanylate cyclase/phosphodiesterase [Marinimicrobium sp. C2-29]|uniref:putative bifunctional diguanylate cyclase/phosphodiesterase n=1 Tax=Marinimicrobium sp. C2-29 TaxID=3139825 RepID=UPI003138AB35
MKKKLPRIAVSLSNSANSHLLEQMLSGEFQLYREFVGFTGQLTHSDIKLLVVDVITLKHRREQIRELRRRVSPVVLPVLLVTEGQGRLHLQVAAELGRTVDDILRIPSSQEELKGRIHNLFRLRSLSREQDLARQQLVRVVSALRTLNACDSIVVRSKTEDELLSSLCSAIVDQEGYRLAWVGFGDEKAGLNISAFAGRASAFVSELQRHWAEDPQSAAGLVHTIRSGRTHIVSDIAANLPFSPIDEQALTHDLAAMILLPLKSENGSPGCLVIYSDTVHHFGEKECQLLKRLADNLVFGLNALRSHKERQQQAVEIHYLAYTDALTGLPNRRHLIHFLKGILEEPESSRQAGAILFIDLDGFKLINDALGHEVGDQVLKQLGQRLQATVRDCDLVVRQGGDEFLVVAVDAPRHDLPHDSATLADIAHHLAARIVAHLSEPLMAGGYTHRLNASVGISLFPDHGLDPTLLIENADKAMYEAKRRGGGHSHLFCEEISTSRQQRFSLETRLRQALEREEFELHYQPIFELDSCRIMATEALIRWPQEDGEILMPGAFMPLVEEIGLINPLGDWVLETAAQQLQRWDGQGFDLAMAVNLSINQLYPDGNAERFAALVEPYIHPSRIHLEVTENALMADPAAIEGLLKALHEQGFQLAIDDFGTGYSSLSRLQHLSIQTLKIDRSFVSELGRPASKGAALVAVIQQMADKLQLQTVAEGIETDAQRQLLLQGSNGRGWGQGFWFSPAVPADALARRLKSDQY